MTSPRPSEAAFETVIEQQLLGRGYVAVPARRLFKSPVPSTRYLFKPLIPNT